VTIGEQIRDLRERQGMTLTELARRSRISKGYLLEIERNKKMHPSLANVERIVSELGARIAIVEGVERYQARSIELEQRIAKVRDIIK